MAQRSGLKPARLVNLRAVLPFTAGLDLVQPQAPVSFWVSRGYPAPTLGLLSLGALGCGESASAFTSIAACRLEAAHHGIGFRHLQQNRCDEIDHSVGA
jgi:hypothetical protein